MGVGRGLRAAENVVPPGLTAADWIRAAVIVVVAVAVAVGLQRLTQALLRRGGSERLAAQLLGRVLGYVVVAVGLVYALSTLGVRIGPLLGALGIGGLALALAAQDLLTNAIDGIVLEVRRQFRRGDLVVTNDVEGIVVDVNLRTVVLRTPDGDRVHVPNQLVLGNVITNHTALGSRRTTLDVGVAYATPLDRAREVALATMAGVDGVLARPAPEAWVTEFGDNAITIALRFWHAPDVATLWRVRNGVAVALKAAYDQAGIEIAFPQRTLWLAGDGWREAMGGAGGGEGGGR